MEIVRLTPSRQAQIIRLACRVLRNGGTIVYPTDTLYGLGADPFSRQAYRNILSIKGRSAKKGISVLAASQAQFQRMASPRAFETRRLREFWPGSVTVVLRKKKNVPLWLTGRRKTIAIRWPKKCFAAALANAFGRPITATSANISGRPGSNSITAVLRQFRHQANQPDLVIDAGRLPARRASAIIRFTRRGQRVLRPGPSSATKAKAHV